MPFWKARDLPGESLEFETGTVSKLGLVSRGEQMTPANTAMQGMRGKRRMAREGSEQTGSRMRSRWTHGNQDRGGRLKLERTDGKTVQREGRTGNPDTQRQRSRTKTMGI